MRTRRKIAVPIAVVVIGALGVPGMAAERDDKGSGAHRLSDGIADTPLEIDRQQARLDGESADDEQHGGPDGHLPGSSKNVDLVGKVNVSGAVGVDKASHIADVAAFGNYAYLAARRLNRAPCGAGGFYTVDISDPANPTEVGFTAFPTDSYPGEGMQVVRLNTPAFKGNVLLTNNENCGSSPDRVGGTSMYDVTDPTNIKPLAIGKGDTSLHPPRANLTHSVFGWQAGKRAFAVLVDNEEVGDVDIVEITDPRRPVTIAETGFIDWPDAYSPLANGESVFLHDLVVKQIKGHFYALLSYWDAGWVVLNVDNPASPKFVRDSDYPVPDPLLGFDPPEGNAHQAEWSHNNKYIIGTDEDFSPTRTTFEMTTGPNAGVYGAGQFGWTRQVSTLPGGVFSGSTVWGGSGCEEDVNGNGTSDRAEVPSQASTGADVVVFTRGVCAFSKKVESGQLAGYDKVIIIQSHAGTRDGLLPNGFVCGSQGHQFVVTAAALCLGHRAGHLLFGDAPAYTGADVADMPALGTAGQSVSATTEFDGWGTIHLLNGTTLSEVDNYSIPEAIDPAYQSGFGSLTVHEVAMDKSENLGYLSWYDAGIRVVRFGAGGIEEVGHYIDPGGNDFWGVEAHRLPGDASETTYILGSDRDSGLWIFRYTGG